MARPRNKSTSRPASPPAGSATEEPAKDFLPTPSRPSTIGALYHALFAKPDLRFRQQELRQREVKDSANARSLLERLRIIGKSGLLTEEFKRVRESPEESLQGFLRNELQRLLDNLGCSGGDLSFLGRKDVPTRDAELAAGQLPLARYPDEKSRSKMKSTVGAIHDTIRNCANRKWLLNEARIPDEEGEGESPESGEFSYKKEFPVDSDAGKIFYGRVSLDRDLTDRPISQRLKTLAFQLLSEAEALQEKEAEEKEQREDVT